MRKKAWCEAGTGYFLLSPTLFVLLLFIIGPILFATFLAFHHLWRGDPHFNDQRE